jgi:hypothetical protein
MVRGEGSDFVVMVMVAGPFLRWWGYEGSSDADVEFRRPRGLAFDPKQSMLFIADSDNHRVQAYQMVNMHVRPGKSQRQQCV